MRRALWSALALLVAGPGPAPGGAIRATAQMGPAARRALAALRGTRERAAAAREVAQAARRVALVRVRVPGDDPDLAVRVARAYERVLVGRGFLVRPFRLPGPPGAPGEADLVDEPLAARQLARRYGVGRLLDVEVRELRLADGRHSGLAVPGWWTPEQAAREFAEVHLKARLFDAGAGSHLPPREDRQFRPVPGPPAREASLAEALTTCIEHTLWDLPGPGVPTGYAGGEPPAGVAGHGSTAPLDARRAAPSAAPDPRPGG